MPSSAQSNPLYEKGVDAFKDGIDALANPAAPRAVEPSTVSAQEMQQAIAELYNRCDVMNHTIKALQATVAGLERQNADLHHPNRGVPWDDFQHFTVTFSQ